MNKLKYYIKTYVLGVRSNVFLLRFFSYFLDDLSVTVDPVAILIAAPGGGNIGDQAMLESFIKNVSGRKIIITSRIDGAKLASPYLDDVSVIYIDGLIYGNSIKFIRAFKAFWPILKRSNALFIVGADVMDGGYNVHASVMRASIAKFTAKKGIPTRVLGFSWCDSPSRLALDAIRGAGDQGVKLYARDPVSYNRLKSSKVKGVTLSADTVFSNQNIEEQGIENVLTYCQGKKIAIVNASGLVSKSMDQVAEYKNIISHLKSLGFHIVLLPHVIREGANDLEICLEIFNSVTDVYIVDTLLTPDQVRRLVAEATLVITGRMHLSIISISRGVPAIVLSTQGKVDGLMDYFSTRSLSIEPKVGFSSEVIKQIDKIFSNYAYYVKLIKDALPSVFELSKKNFND